MTIADSNETPLHYGMPIQISVILPVHNETETIAGLISVGSGWN